ncbi:MAG TPA: pantoate--beta-alanine ligase [Isosphaeraceae bacterium]|nr:pantoate--beta-alanine ligase [Isosphaeraceae bacterium]
MESIEVVRRAVAAARRAGGTIGLVPTMGALHDGHLRLIERCRAESDLVVVSIFVNPTQFGPSEDLERYPRTLAEDCARCDAAGAEVIFAPQVATIYPHGTGSTFVEVPGLSDVLEGASRPGHFRGVATVVLKLFAIVGPDRAYFGQKDYQQQVLIRRMVADLHVPVAITTVPTVREPDGLALSSRNRYLNPAQRRAATVLARALERAGQAVVQGERIGNRVRQILRETIESEPLARLDYAEVADAETLAPLDELGPQRPAVALVAAWVGSTRLIDNRLLG